MWQYLWRCKSKLEIELQPSWKVLLLKIHQHAFVRKSQKKFCLNYFHSRFSEWDIMYLNFNEAFDKIPCNILICRLNMDCIACITESISWKLSLECKFLSTLIIEMIVRHVTQKLLGLNCSKKHVQKM